MRKEYDPVTGEEIEKRKRKPIKFIGGNMDFNLLLVWIFIMLLGYVMLYSASSYVAAANFDGDSAYYLKKQLFATAIGLVPMILVIHFDYRGWKNLNLFIYIASLVSVVAVLTPLGIESHGARRWINLGVIQFQPAELVKLAVILMTATAIAKCGEGTLKDIKNCWRIYLITLVPTAMVMVFTSNMSSSIIIAMIGFIMLFVAGACAKFIWSVIGVGAGGLTLMILAGSIMGESFRLSRVMVWLNPEEYSDSGGYQVLQGLYAIGSGGLFGKGLGNSSQKLGFVPEPTNDMIFSIVCEELGIFGAACIICLFIFMIVRMRNIASNSPDFYGSMLVIGVLAHIATQVVLNIAVVTNSMPNTGVSLPFVSYGGTSLLFLMAEVGIVLGVSSRIKQFK